MKKCVKLVIRKNLEHLLWKYCWIYSCRSYRMYLCVFREIFRQSSIEVAEQNIIT